MCSFLSAKKDIKAQEKGNTCMICHENVNKTYHKRDMVLGNMADNLMLTKDNQDEDRIEYNARR